MKKLLLSAAILTAFVTGVQAMEPDEDSLRWAIGRLSGDKTGQPFEFRDEKERTWHGANVSNPHDLPLINLYTGAVPVFTHTGPKQCHVSFVKRITEGGMEAGFKTILTADLTQE